MSRARLFFFGCLLAATYFVYTAGVGALHAHSIAQQESEASREVAELRAKSAHLKSVMDYVGSDAYVEQEARRRLGYVRDGEIPMVVLSPSLPAQPEQNGEWWERLFPR